MKERENMYKLAVLDTHPIQYHVPMFRELAKKGDMELMAYFTCDSGITKPIKDPGLQRKIMWDTPLLEGYSWKLLKNQSPRPSPNAFFGQINMGILMELRQKKYDAILIYGYAGATNWIVCAMRRWTKTPIILRGEAYLTPTKKWWKAKAKEILLRWLFKRIDVFLWSSRANKEFFRYYGVPEEKLFFAPSAVDNEFFQTQGKQWEKDDVRKELGIENKNPIVLFVGKFIPKKRPLDLLRACARLDLPYNLVLVGGGEEEDMLRTYAKEKSIPAFFVGFKNQTELPKYYKGADVLALPSEHDPSPKVLHEAFALGLPAVVSSSVGTAEDLVEESKSGIVFKKGDTSELAEALQLLLSDREKRKEMGRRAEEASRKWSLEEDRKGVESALAYIQKNHEIIHHS